MSSTYKKDRSWIHIVSRLSNWKEKDVLEALRENVYADKKNWQKFLKLFFLVSGVAFITAGIIFFFAYNWQGLHKFLKMGLIQTLLLGSLVFYFLFQKNKMIQQALLLAATFLVGVSFAVYGQIYQTGANAYDFFLGWTVFVAVWVFVSYFPLLWLVFIGLINTTVILYSEQVVRNWDFTLVSGICFGINAGFLVYFEWKNSKISFTSKKMPYWFLIIVAIAAACFLTLSLISGIFQGLTLTWVLFFVIGLILSCRGLWRSNKRREIFYMALIPFCGIIVMSAFIIKILHEPIAAFFLVSVFVVASISFLINHIVKLNKQWHGAIEAEMA